MKDGGCLNTKSSIHPPPPNKKNGVKTKDCILWDK
jgi:hypothetical protein